MSVDPPIQKMTPALLRSMLGVDTVPRPLEWAGAARFYPDALRGSGREGSVLVDASIDVEGRVAAVEIVPRPAPGGEPMPPVIARLQSPDGTARDLEPATARDAEDFGEAARAMVRAMRFEPAMRDGMPVPFLMRMTVAIAE